MFPELGSLDKMCCWDLIDEKDVPKGEKLISGRWVFVEKYDEFGQPKRKNGRYVIRGFSMIPDVQYSI